MNDLIPPGTDLNLIGLKPNPNGQPPNLIDPPSQASLVIGSGIALSAMSAVLVCMRLATNFKFTKKLKIDDYLCVVAQVLMTVYVAMCISLRDAYKHSYDVPLSMLTDDYAKKSFVLNVIVGPAFWASKTAILALYIRLFSVEKTVRYMSYAAIVVLFFLYWTLVPVAAVHCTPRNGAPWVAALQACSDHTKVHGPIQGVCGTVADVFIMVLPIPTMKKLRLPRGKKIGLMVVFATGFLAIVASAIALYYRFEIWRDWDTWRTAPMYTAAFFECFITIMVSCAPALYSFWSNYFINSSLYNSVRSRFSAKSINASWASKSGKTLGTGVSDPYQRFYSSPSSVHSSSKQHILEATESSRGIPLTPVQKR